MSTQTWKQLYSIRSPNRECINSVKYFCPWGEHFLLQVFTSRVFQKTYDFSILLDLFKNTNSSTNLVVHVETSQRNGKILQSMFMHRLKLHCFEWIWWTPILQLSTIIWGMRLYSSNQGLFTVLQNYRKIAHFPCSPSTAACSECFTGNQWDHQGEGRTSLEGPLAFHKCSCAPDRTTQWQKHTDPLCPPTERERMIHIQVKLVIASFPHVKYSLVITHFVFKTMIWYYSKW